MGPPRWVAENGFPSVSAPCVLRSPPGATECEAAPQLSRAALTEAMVDYSKFNNIEDSDEEPIWQTEALRRRGGDSGPARPRKILPRSYCVFRG